MKIIKNKQFQEIKEDSHNHWLKRLGLAGAALLVFALVFSFLYSMAAPTHFSQKDIPQSYAVVESEDGTYFGPLLDMCYEGTGEFRHLDGGIYDGEFSKSKRSGTGTFHFANGDTYSGTWADDQMVEGTYTFADGRTYQGKFSDGKFSSGTFTLGKSAEARGYSDFTADIDNGQVTSLSFQQKDGLHYNGEVNGYAEITYADGNKYAGDVKNGVSDGKGTFRWISGGSQTASYVGSWSQGVMSGSGTYYYTAGDYPNITGSFVNGKLNGTAQYYKEAGKSFKTSWENGVCKNNNVH
ncbi:hypothetical protein [uncultured Mitsuokella sp.]|uniref:hypothetical protein n=1 Tax=uncultured Mitsuokella sp. TaxID=453120 RepID=UPI00266FD0B9|nr:hypothetical protein [uncultured Mitsuokella sp.]